MIRQVIVIAALISSCGNEVKVKIVREPQPKVFEVGERAHFSFDPLQSSKLIQSGHLTIEVTGKNERMTAFSGMANVETVIGAKEFAVAGEVENSALTLDYLKKLRVSKADTLANASVSYVGMSDEGCDTLTLTGIRGYPDLSLSPTLCVSSRSVPRVKVGVRQKGLLIDAVFQADE